MTFVGTNYAVVVFGRISTLIELCSPIIAFRKPFKGFSRPIEGLFNTKKAPRSGDEACKSPLQDHHISILVPLNAQKASFTAFQSNQKGIQRFLLTIRGFMISIKRFGNPI